MTSLVGYFIGQLIATATSGEKSVAQTKTQALEIEWYYSPETHEDLLIVGDSHTYEQRIEWLDGHPDALIIEPCERAVEWPQG